MIDEALFGNSNIDFKKADIFSLGITILELILSKLSRLKINSKRKENKV
jgi:hypothetical protein